MVNLKPFLKQQKVKNLLAIFPHPDDESYIAGGLFLLTNRLNIQTRLICLTHGEKGINYIGNGNLKKLRKTELKKAANILKINSFKSKGLVM